MVQVDVPEIKDRSDADARMEIFTAAEPDESITHGLCKYEQMALLKQDYAEKY